MCQHCALDRARAQAGAHASREQQTNPKEPSFLSVGQSVGLTGPSDPAEEPLQVEASVRVSFHVFEQRVLSKKTSYASLGGTQKSLVLPRKGILLLSAPGKLKPLPLSSE